MKPIISYYGGKQRIASRIVKLLPKHTVYCEPFCGGGAVFWAKPWPKVTNTSHYREILNDKDERIINFYRCLQNPETRMELIERLELTLYSEAEYWKAKDIDIGTHVDRAWAYYVNIMQSFSNKLNGGWGRDVFTNNSAATWMNKVHNLRQYLQRMAAIYISCQDALTCIQQWDAPQTCFYCDPPYPGTDQGHYKGYSTADFQNLVDCLNNIKGSFVLSCYDFDGMKIPTRWERFEIETYCSASGKGKIKADRSRKATADELGNRKRTEVIYRVIQREVRDELKPLYDGNQLAMFA